LESEIRHGPGGGADVQGVACGYQDHAQIVFPVRLDASIVPQSFSIDRRRCSWGEETGALRGVADFEHARWQAMVDSCLGAFVPVAEHDFSCRDSWFGGE
jgi:hypothetical protein